MAKIEMAGLNEYTAKLSQLERDVRAKVCAPAIYSAADIVANEVRSQLDALPTDGGTAGSGRVLRGPNQVQKAALLASFGITKLRDDSGYLNVKLGFSGYNGIITKRWPQGQPNAMVARSVERGTSFMAKNPFRKKAVATTQKQALDTMAKAVDREITKIMK